MNTKELRKLDKSHVWHPFTQMQEWYEDDILVIEKGEGSYLTSTDGNRYLDAISSLWVTVHGHNHPFINKAIREQLKLIDHSTLLGFSNSPAIRLAKKLVDITPMGLNKVFYSDSGSTSVEIALKMAFQYWFLKGEQRPYFVKFTDTYHGDTLGSVSVGGMQVFHDIFGPLLFKTFEIPWPHTYWRKKGLNQSEFKKYSLARLEDTLKKNSHKISALITEPLIQGASGMSVAPKGFLKDVAKLCKKFGILLIVDEVATGFGRTGTMFACEQENVSPDILCTAKGLTGGYLPLAATLATDNIYNQFLGEYKEFKTFFHGHTYTGNPLACAAALANISLFKKEKTLNKMPKKILFLTRLLAEIKELTHVGDVRQCGFMIGIELIKDKKKQKAFLVTDKMGIKVCRYARDKGVILRPLGNVIVLMPPLSISRKDLKFLIKVVKQSIIAVIIS